MRIAFCGLRQAARPEQARCWTKRCALASAFAVLPLSTGAHGNEPERSVGSSVHPKSEYSVGVTVAADDWAVYAGGTRAIFGTLAEPGFRLRAVSGYGRYRYEGVRDDPLTNTAVNMRFRGVSAFADVLAGLQFQSGSVTLKAFAGATMLETGTVPLDDYVAPLGRRIGAKGLAEIWWAVTPEVWLAVDLGAATLDRQRAAKLRLGYRLTQALSVGIEGQHMATTATEIDRLGVLLRFERERFEVSLSGGAAHGPGTGITGYATGQLLVRY